MKRWAIVTVALYALLLLLLTVPAVLIGWLRWSSQDGTWQLDIPLREALDLFRAWGYWLWLAVMVMAQALMLLVPIDLSERRLTRRRRLVVPVVVGAFLLGNLCLAGMFSLLGVAMRDDAGKVLEIPASLTEQITAEVPGLHGAITSLGLTPNSDLFAVLNLIGLILLVWLVWGLVFYQATKSDEAGTLLSRATRWLLRGSIVELLVAVPSHIIVRQRGDCCAPYATFWGIVTGLSVMLLSFGPGVLFLFAARVRQKRGRLVPPLIASS